MVATPDRDAIIKCNTSYKSCLYKEPIDVERAIEQHRNLVKTLRDHSITVIDVMDEARQASQELHDTTHHDISNLVFTRDPFLCTSHGILHGKLKEPIRRKEPDILQALLYQHTQHTQHACIVHKVQGQNSFVEGGDYIPLGNMCLIANGSRTNLEGIFEVMSSDMLGANIVGIVHFPSNSNMNTMNTIHLDCYLGIVGNTHAVIWDYASENAHVSVYKKDDQGKYIPLSHTTPLGVFLVMCGFTLIPVDATCQKSYGCNLLDLGNGKVLTQDDYVTMKLTELGYNAIYVPFDEIHKMYGGIRCATQVLYRKRT